MQFHYYYLKIGPMSPHAHFVDFSCYIDKPMPGESIRIKVNYVASKIFSRLKCNLKGLNLLWQHDKFLYIYAPYQAPYHGTIKEDSAPLFLCIRIP